MLEILKDNCYSQSNVVFRFDFCCLENVALSICINLTFFSLVSVHPKEP